MRIFRFQQNKTKSITNRRLWCFMSETTYHYRDGYREPRYSQFYRKQGGFIQINFEEELHD